MRSYVCCVTWYNGSVLLQLNINLLKLNLLIMMLINEFKKSIEWENCVGREDEFNITVRLAATLSHAETCVNKLGTTVL
jgi:hypothetical protein